MLKQKEIVEISLNKQVPKAIIDKDWVLGHFLNAMFSFGEVRNKFVFKGGTCLHKCYIEDYRFSEDLDFTLLDTEFNVNEVFINKIMQTAYEQSGIKFYLADLNYQYSDNIQQGYKAGIKYWGADHNPNQRPLPPMRWQTSISIDISFSEQLLLPAIEKNIIHPYSDNRLIVNSVLCYDLIELLSEKIRALKQRNRPRDVYDVWYLSKIKSQNLDELKDLILKKSDIKGLKIKSKNDFETGEKPCATKERGHKAL